MAPLAEIPFVKGHGTGNDFIVIPDLDDQLDVTADDVRWLCDRHRGIGADGVIRVVRGDDGMPFMDYRNADGSLAEMCGNGARVFIRFLYARGLIGEHCLFRTRGGIRQAWMNPDRTVTVDMGTITVRRNPVSIHHAGSDFPATAVDAPNPHAVVFVDSIEEIGSLHVPPTATLDEFPDGVNVEFVERCEEGRVRMRIHERGVGETMSCGTGACAVAAVVGGAVDIDVPGGTVHVTFNDEGHALLRGTADLVARGTALLPVSH